jgi:hypothetical protein
MYKGALSMRELNELLNRTAKNLEAFGHPRVSIAWQDLDLTFTRVHNPSPDLGTGIIGKKLSDVMDDQPEAERLSDIKRRVIRTRELYVETICIELGGRKHFYDISIEPTYDGHGKIDGLMSVNIDMTDVMEARAQLKEANDRMIGHLGQVMNMPTTGIRLTRETKLKDI